MADLGPFAMPPVDPAPTEPVKRTRTARGISARKVATIFEEQPTGTELSIDEIAAYLKIDPTVPQNRNGIGAACRRLIDDGLVALTTARGVYRHLGPHQPPVNDPGFTIPPGMVTDLDATINSLLEMVLLDVGAAGAKDAMIPVSALPLVDEWRAVTRRLLAVVR